MKLTTFILLALSVVSLGQDLRNSHFFFNPLIDVSENNFVEASVVANEYANYNREYLGLSGNYNFNNFTIGTELALPEASSANFEPSFIRIGGRYNLFIDDIKLSVGSLLDLTNQFSINSQSFVSAFSAARYSINDKLELAASVSLKSNTVFEDFDELLGFGGIISLLPQLNLLTEMNYSIEHNNLDYGGGLEYEITEMFDLRGGYFFNRDRETNTIFVGIVINKLKF